MIVKMVLSSVWFRLLQPPFVLDGEIVVKNFRGKSSLIRETNKSCWVIAEERLLDNNAFHGFTSFGTYIGNIIPYTIQTGGMLSRTSPPPLESCHSNKGVFGVGLFREQILPNFFKSALLEA